MAQLINHLTLDLRAVRSPCWTPCWVWSLLEISQSVWLKYEGESFAQSITFVL